MRYVLTGGGTGGHIYPALAVAFSLREKGHDILFLGQKKGLEGKIVPEAGFPMEDIVAAPLTRRLSPKLFMSIFRALRGTWQARHYLKNFQPDVVIGTGGYAAGPVMMAAVLLRLPTLIHEQNAYPSLTNRLLSPFVQTACISFAASEEYFPRARHIVLTGSPVRQQILQYKRSQGRKEYNLEPDQKMILIMGGSQGAYSINKAVVGWLQKRKKIAPHRVLHVAGKRNIEDVHAAYEKAGIVNLLQGDIILVDYLDSMEKAYAAADLVVARSGAMTLAEITARGLPSILVPYPHAAEGHQTVNAQSMVEANAAFLLEDEEVEGKLGPIIERLLQDEKRLKEMGRAAKSLGHPQALDKILHEIDRLTP